MLGGAQCERRSGLTRLSPTGCGVLMFIYTERWYGVRYAVGDGFATQGAAGPAGPARIDWLGRFWDGRQSLGRRRGSGLGHGHGLGTYEGSGVEISASFAQLQI